MTIQPPPVSPQPDAPDRDQTFSIVPKSILTDARVSDLDFRVWTLCDNHLMGQPGHVKEQTLAEELNKSIRSIERAVAKLVRLGYLERSPRSRTKSGGWAVCQTTVVNVARKRSQPPAKSGGRHPSNLADIRSTSSRNNKQQQGASPAEGRETPAPTAPSAAGGPAEELLSAVREATGAPVEMNPRVRRDLLKIAARGITGPELGVEVAAWMAVKEADVIRPAGFIVGVVLPAIAQGSEVPSAEPLLPTPTPPAIRDLYSAEPCQHGDPRGASSCALCRHATTTMGAPR